MEFALWSALVGLLLVGMALTDSVLARLPLSTSMLYLLVGAALSPLVFELASIRPLEHVALLEHLAELVVLLSLFTSGLKMSEALSSGRWMLPVRLAVGSMVVTVAAIAVIGHVGLGLPLGAAILLGALLAPTDPVLAADVQVAEPGDRDRLRFALTGEAGLNDGSAFPFVMLGLGLLGLHEIGEFGWRWVAVDVVWATVWGLGVGATLGHLVGRFVLYLRRTYQEAVGLDSFLGLGLVAISYGVAVLGLGYGFLAVFAAGVALRRVEQRETSIAEELAKAQVDATAAAPAATATTTPETAVRGALQAAGARVQARSDDTGGARAADTAARGANGGSVADAAPVDPVAAAIGSTMLAEAEKLATHQHHAPAYMAHAVLSFNTELEHIGEVAAVIVVGMMLWAVEWHRVPWWFVPVLLLLVRPVSVAIGLAGSRTSASQRALIGWFGIRGIGSLYYLMYAIHKGLDQDLAQTLIALTLACVVVSITVHGVSVTPLMNLYARGRRRDAEAAKVPD